MVKRTLDIYECDTCGEEGQRYVVLFPDGALTMDRCVVHSKKVEGLRGEGSWQAKAKGRGSHFQKSSVTEIKQAIENDKRDK